MKGEISLDCIKAKVSKNIFKLLRRVKKRPIYRRKSRYHALSYGNLRRQYSDINKTHCCVAVSQKLKNGSIDLNCNNTY